VRKVDNVRTDILIVGAGFAGAATAFHLSRLTDRAILLVDREEIPGFHASGRNASLLMQSAESPAIKKLIISSQQAYQSHLGSALHTTGSFLLGSAGQMKTIHEPDLLPSRLCEPEEVKELIPLLEGHAFEQALFTPSDAVVDIAALLQFYLHGAAQKGTRLLLGCRAGQVRYDGAFRVSTTRGEITADYMINAAGAWSSALAASCAATPVPLVPLKRHLFVLGDLGPVRHDWPFVWNIARNFYFRPESGQLLFCICDEQVTPSLEPTIEPETVEELAELIWSQLPAMQDAVQKKVWSCFRTKTPDGLFVIGPDPRIENFFWVAGLGGHGMGSSWEVGRLASELLLGMADNSRNAFDPARFAVNGISAAPSANQSPLES
jgi:D-arginine dehydrogenase